MNNKNKYKQYLQITRKLRSSLIDNNIDCAQLCVIGTPVIL